MENQTSGSLQSLPQEDAPYKVYASKEDWQKDIDGIIGGRLKDYRQLKEELEAFKQQAQETAAEQEAANAVNDWYQQLTALAEEYPAFDIEEAVQNPAFTEGIANGLDAKQAYILSHHDKLVQEAVDSAKDIFMSEIKANGQRIVENGIMPARNVAVKVDPTKLSSAQIDALAERARRGEKIRF